MSDSVQPSPTWTVSELHDAISGVLTHVFGEETWVEGELRNVSRSANQHVYFDLVDPDDERGANRPMLAVTLFSRERQAVNRFLTEQGGAVRMTDGVRVRIRGRLDMYPARSTVQLRMTGIDPAFTLGVMDLERDRLLATLGTEGLLDANARRRLVDAPLHVALITSVGSAAHADALDELTRADIGFRVRVIDARTQGADSERSLVRAFRSATALGVDVVLLARGGGARTDLVTFDSEAVARSIATMAVPVFTGIGHEIDHSVADEVAHTAFKTPTACAAALVEHTRLAKDSIGALWQRATGAACSDLLDAARRLDDAGRRTERGATRHLERDRQRIDHLRSSVLRCAPRIGVAAHSRVDDTWRRVPVATRSLAMRSAELTALAARARSHDPLLVMRRGWAIVRTGDGRIVRSASDVATGDEIVTVLSDGEVHSTVQRSTQSRVPTQDRTARAASEPGAMVYEVDDRDGANSAEER